DAMVVTFASHLAAERPYRMRLHKPALSRLLVFGAPLMATGIVLFAVGQGDRVMVGSLLGVEELAYYSVAAIIAGGASSLAMRIISALYVPLLSVAHADGANFSRRYRLCGAIAALASFCIVFPLVIAGPTIISILYGASYHVPPLVIAWLGLVAGA